MGATSVLSLGRLSALGDERCGGSGVLVPLGPPEPSFGGP